MANEEHLAILKQGVEVWNAWREANPAIKPDLSKADLREVDFEYANLAGAILSQVNLSGANLSGADLVLADLSKADLKGARLIVADLSGVNLSGVDLSGASLIASIMVGATLEGANLTNCRVYGISAWDLNLVKAKQDNLIITKPDEPTITVDNLEVAQFIYLMLNSQKVRSVLEAITTKSVLILGRFSGPMKDTLDAIREKLRELDYLPIIFDFERLSGKDYTETIRVLAGMSKFVIADLSGAKSIQQELQAIIPDFELPVVPIIQQGEEVWSMFESHQRADHVLPVVQYTDSDHLIARFERIIVIAENRRKEISLKKAKHDIETVSIDDLPDE